MFFLRYIVKLTHHPNWCLPKRDDDLRDCLGWNGKCFSIFVAHGARRSSARAEATGSKVTSARRPECWPEVLVLLCAKTHFSHILKCKRAI